MTANAERFLVTGAAGCIGAWTVRQLLDERVAVIAADLTDDRRRLDLVSQGRETARVDFVHLDVTRRADVAALVKERDITHIVHLAGLQVPFCAADPSLGAMVNVVGTVNVFEAVRGAGRDIGLVYASSGAVYGASSSDSSGVVGDSARPVPDSHYGVYKMANESTARIYAITNGVGSVGLRPFVVYGVGRDQGMTSDVTKAMLAAAARVPYHIKFGGSVLLTHAEDCARTFIAAARAARGCGDAICLNVPGRRVAIASLVELVGAIVPESQGLITGEREPITFPALLQASALEAVIGRVFNRSLEEGVRDTIRRFEAALTAGVLAVSWAEEEDRPGIPHSVE